MDQIGIRELRGNISMFVKQAGAGRPVTITIDGRPIAQLVAPSRAKKDPELADLAAQGRLVLRETAPVVTERDPVPTWAGFRMDRLVREVRGR